MTKFVANFEFGGDMAPEDVQGWVDAIQGELPEGAIASVRQVPLVLDINEVTDAHAGNRVMIRGFYRKVGKLVFDNARENLHGTLEHVYMTGDAPARRTLVIDGAAYDIPAYSLVELGEW